MTSKYDRPDPSLDRDYTEGLSVEDNDTPIDPFDAQDILEYCLWCNDLVPEDELGPYCSPLCANRALADDCER